jgi:single stranded DNA-binding protein (ssb)
MNNCNFIGRICNDLKIEQAGDISVVGVNFALKTSRKDENGQYRTAFLNCKAFGKTAENIQKYFKKGDAIGITCAISDDSYTKEDGKRVSKIGFIINNFTFIENKTNTESNNNNEDCPF